LRAYRRLVRDSQEDQHKHHTVVDDWSEADLILAPINDWGYGPNFDALDEWKPFPAMRSRIVMYTPDDTVFPVMPGLYPACTRSWQQRSWALPAHYRSDHLPQFSIRRDELGARDLLFSFVGSACTSAVRERIMQIAAPASLIRDVSFKNGKRWWDGPESQQEEMQLEFRHLLLRSKFVLCPRGVIATSIRIYEAMEAGAVPVIIADDISLPLGPDWDSFSIFIPESQITSIPAILRNFEPDVSAMADRARDAWERYFSPQSSFQSFVEWAAQLQSARRSSPVSAGLASLMRLAPRSLWADVRYKLSEQPS
jgi:hypothetical protein